MPTYQYACTSPECGNKFELVQSFTDASASECPVCAGPVRKVFSAVGVVFKGSGFYRTDSRSSGSAPDGASKSGESAAKSGEPAKSSAEKGSSSSDSSSKSTADSSSSSTSSSSTSSSTSKAAAPA